MVVFVLGLLGGECQADVQRGRGGLVCGVVDARGVWGRPGWEVGELDVPAVLKLPESRVQGGVSRPVGGGCCAIGECGGVQPGEWPCGAVMGSERGEHEPGCELVCASARFWRCRFGGHGACTG